MKFRFFFAAFLFLIAFNVKAWNAAGHELIAQMAFEYLSPSAKTEIAALIGRKNSPLKLHTFLRASIWMDQNQQRMNPSLRVLHYIDLPFSFDASKLPAVQRSNALTALIKAELSLKSPATPFREKQKQLKILLHVLADIHQPLHTIAKISQFLPEGDKGGNLTPIYATEVSRNLHGFWDKAGGWLQQGQANQSIWLRHETARLVKTYPCYTMIVNYPAWIHESYTLAIMYAYGKLGIDSIIDSAYVEMTEQLSQQQIAIAACRLAISLNTIFI